MLFRPERKRSGFLLPNCLLLIVKKKLIIARRENSLILVMTDWLKFDMVIATQYG